MKLISPDSPVKLENVTATWKRGRTASFFPCFSALRSLFKRYALSGYNMQLSRLARLMSRSLAARTCRRPDFRCHATHSSRLRCTFPPAASFAPCLFPPAWKLPFLVHESTFGEWAEVERWQAKKGLKGFSLFWDFFVIRRFKQSSKDKVSRLFTRNHGEYCWNFFELERESLILEIFFYDAISQNFRKSRSFKVDN